MAAGSGLILNYAQRSSRRSRWLLGSAAIALLLLLAFSIPTPVPFQTVTSHVDAIGGTMTFRTDDWFGLRTRTDVRPSALAQRFQRAGLQWSADWRFLHERSGRSTACGTAPPNYLICGFSRDLFDRLSDDEVRSLFLALSSGDDDRAEAAVKLASDLVFKDRPLPNAP